MELPETISTEQVVEAAKALGIDAAFTQEIVLRGGAVDVVAFKVDSDGNRYLNVTGENYAKYTKTIPTN